jgi:hypothetical protein
MAGGEEAMGTREGDAAPKANAGVSAMGPKSVAAWVERALRVVSVLAIIGLIAVGGLMLLTVSMAALGSQSPMARGLVVSGPGLLLAAISLGVVYIIAVQLRAVFETLRDRDPFKPENARRLRVVALALAVLELARYFTSGAVALLVRIFGQPQTEVVDSNLVVDLGAWGAVLIIWVLSEVFREGARMRADQELTI